MKIKKIQIILRKNMKNLYFLLKDVISQFQQRKKTKNSSINYHKNIFVKKTN
jgi:hypothetical protein